MLLAPPSLASALSPTPCHYNLIHQQQTISRYPDLPAPLHSSLGLIYHYVMLCGKVLFLHLDLTKYCSHS